MKRYDTYKDSGVQWIGEIPSHWDVSRLKFYGNIKSGDGITSNLIQEEGLYEVWGGNGLMGFCDKYNIEEQNIVIGRVGALCGNVRISKSKRFITDNALVFKPSYKANTEFLSLFMTFADLNKLNTSSAQPLITGTKVLDLSFVVPPIDEQTAIANYLDNKCSKIDNVIAAQEKRVELLRELKQSIITRAVTRGINPNVKMKDSGVEWIGEIPKHWEVKKLKYLFENLDYLRQPITADQRSKENPIYDYYGASGVIDKIDFYNVDDTVLLIGEDGANLVFRNLPLIYKASGKFWVNNHAHILKPLAGVDYEYMFYTMECADYSTFITGSAQPKLSQEKINQVQYPLPPIDEQEAIVTYIEQQTSKLDSSITKALRQIELLKEYKQSLITEVVTGKRKVC